MYSFGWNSVGGFFIVKIKIEFYRNKNIEFIPFRWEQSIRGPDREWLGGLDQIQRVNREVRLENVALKNQTQNIPGFEKMIENNFKTTFLWSTSIKILSGNP